MGRKTIHDEEFPQAGWPVPRETKEEFTDFTRAEGTLAQADCAGALFIWQYLPAQLRQRAKRDSQTVPRKDEALAFWIRFAAALDDTSSELLLRSVERVAEMAHGPLEPAAGTLRAASEAIQGHSRPARDRRPAG